jgi:hypothetical protein
MLWKDNNIELKHTLGTDRPFWKLCKTRVDRAF